MFCTEVACIGVCIVCGYFMLDDVGLFLFYLLLIAWNLYIFLCVDCMEGDCRCDENLDPEGVAQLIGARTGAIRRAPGAVPSIHLLHFAILSFDNAS